MKAAALWEEHRRAQRQRRKSRVKDRAEEILALRGKGYIVDEIGPRHFRVDGELDLFPTHRTYLFHPTKVSGQYKNALECAVWFLRRIE